MQPEGIRILPLHEMRPIIAELETAIFAYGNAVDHLEGLVNRYPEKELIERLLANVRRSHSEAGTLFEQAKTLVKIR